jgi:hypothetical protein
VRYHTHMSPLRGMTLVDVIVGTALVLIVFMGIFGLIRASLQLSGLAKLKAAATEIAESQMEYIRSLEYDEVGTMGGIPAGSISQHASTTNAGLVFDVRTYIIYVDDPADGEGAADATGITTDYKLAKVVVSYEAGSIARDVTLISNIAPEGVETTTGGGTLRISVVDATGDPVSGATVHIENPSTSPTVDFSTFSDVSGIVLLPGAPTSTDYRIEVEKTGYSSAATYARDGTNANPTPGYLTVVGGSTTSGTFAIDLLASLILRTFSPIQAFVSTDLMNSSSGFASFTNAHVTGSTLTLTGAPGTYPSSGSARATATTPNYLASWVNASSTTSLPAGTAARMSVADGTGTLLSDAVLLGNSAGFTGTIDLSSVSTSTYPSLALVATLTSSDPNVAPQILDWSLGYTAGPIPLPNVPFGLTGAKTIGSTSGGAAIYKTQIASTTGSLATYTSDLEWDLYMLSLTGYDIVLESIESPYELLPGTDVDVSLILTPH